VVRIGGLTPRSPGPLVVFPGGSGVPNETLAADVRLAKASRAAAALPRTVMSIERKRDQATAGDASRCVKQGTRLGAATAARGTLRTGQAHSGRARK
jgi:hypothetical protein